ncbi:MAG: LysR family transcriptional regulator [Proteobacteria bacterium]|jgi:molybdate transport system regulatory protein|nr:LysR family transcriptional regulator [Pseudomonadota bacterium]
MRIAYKVWLDNDGKAFGEGPYRVLKQIEKAGSLHQAAIDLKISYRKAWLIINIIEKKLGFDFLERKIGGLSGGGSNITPSGKAFLKKYEDFRRELEQVLENTYQKHFGV